MSELPLELPVWMFDRPACSSVRFVEISRVDLPALFALHFLLAEIADIDGGELDLPSAISALRNKYSPN